MRGAQVDGPDESPELSAAQKAAGKEAAWKAYQMTKAANAQAEGGPAGPSGGGEKVPVKVASGEDTGQ